MTVLREGSYGAEVRALRRTMNRITGYPHLSNSAKFDDKMALLLWRLQGLLNLETDSVYGPKTAAAFEIYQSRLDEQPFSDPIDLHPQLIDLRDEMVPRLASGWMDIQRLHGITIHQTGCQFGNCSDERLKRINATFLIRQNGKAYLLNDPRVFIWHAQGLSYFTMGLEVEGNFAGLEGDPKTVWMPSTQGGPDQFTDVMLWAGDIIFQYVRDFFFRNGITWDRVHAHRQSSSGRTWDPGEVIWKLLAVPWKQRLCIPHGSTGLPGYRLLPYGEKLGSGKDIHPGWKPSPEAVWDRSVEAGLIGR